MGVAMPSTTPYSSITTARCVLERRNWSSICITVMLSGARPEHERVLREMGVHERLAHVRHLFATTPEAIAHAREHVAREANPHRERADPAVPAP